ncbi:hypothetical protein C8R44DRAFT_861213 [Mycena epipterygia]|nr:hypothetical protein C8R44DRAFT_861213 [Mycena epipterygia]
MKSYNWRPYLCLGSDLTGLFRFCPVEFQNGSGDYHLASKNYGIFRAAPSTVLGRAPKPRSKGRPVGPSFVLFPHPSSYLPPAHFHSQYGAQVSAVLPFKRKGLFRPLSFILTAIISPRIAWLRRIPVRSPRAASVFIEILDGGVTVGLQPYHARRKKRGSKTICVLWSGFWVHPVYRSFLALGFN